jgi:O-antigen/teichoic acid export membrane protein
MTCGATDSWPGLVRALWVTLSGDGTGKLALAVALLLAGRYLDPVEFAQLGGLQAAAIVSASLWDFGLGAITTRRLSSGELSLRAAVQRVVRLRLATLPLLVAAFVLLTLAVSHIGLPSEPVIAVMFGVSFVFGANTMAVCLLRGTLRFGVAGVAIGAGRVVMLGAVVSIAVTAPSLLGFSVALLVGELATFVLLVRSLTDLGDRRLGAELITLASAAPYALAGVMQVAYNRIDTIVVSAIAAAAVAADYIPASRAQDALYVIPAALSAIALPFQARAGHDARSALSGLRRMIVLGLVASTIVALALTASASMLVRAFLGPSYSGAVLPIQVISWSLPLVATNAILYATVIARGLRKALVVANAVALSFAVLLNILLVPPFGAVGGSVAALSRELPIALILWTALRRTGRQSRQLLAPVAT